jgi:DNA-binding NtrC family response regulator
METRKTILVIDDGDDLKRFSERLMGGQFFFVHATSSVDARKLLERHEIAAVLLDRDFSRTDVRLLLGPPEDVRNEGIHILRWLKGDRPALPVLMVTGFREQKPALEAADLGTDFLAWEDVIEDPGILRARLLRAIESTDGGIAAILDRFRAQNVVVESPEFAKTLVAIHNALPGDAPILLLGETGTGKDHLAFAAHALSGDSRRPFVNVNVAALPPSLIESELFGHARGAYTSAEKPAIGKLRAAHGGTLFLNEIGELPQEVQAKLLTALERNEVVPVGDVQSYPADFRLISATSRDLGGMVESGGFRRDLFYRVAWHIIEIPPLRKRPEDIPALIRAFLRTAGQGSEEGITGIAKEASDYLCQQPWMGNVRELRAVVEASSAVARYIVMLSDVREVVRRHGEFALPVMARRDAAPAATGTEDSDALRCEESFFAGLALEELKNRYIRYLWRATGGRLPEMARRAGVAKSTIYELYRKSQRGRESSSADTEHRD